jgi:hypothetical protein
MSFQNIITLFKDCCHSEKVFFSLSFSNSFSSNSNSFLLNSKIAKQQWSRCRGYYELLLIFEAENSAFGQGIMQAAEESLNFNILLLKIRGNMTF